MSISVSPWSPANQWCHQGRSPGAIIPWAVSATRNVLLVPSVIAAIVVALPL